MEGSTTCSMCEYMDAPAGAIDSYQVYDYIDWQLGNTSLETPGGMALFTHLSEKFYSPHDRNHGLPHILNVWSHARNICRLENKLGSDELKALQISILSHDSIRYGCHKPAEESALQIEKLLARRNRLRPHLIQSVTHAIASHSSPRAGWFSNDLVTQTLYNADKSDLDRHRWIEEGIDPNKYKPIHIEDIYRYYGYAVLDTVSSHYPAKIVNQKLLEQQLLKQAYENSI